MLCDVICAHSNLQHSPFRRHQFSPLWCCPPELSSRRIPTPPDPDVQLFRVVPSSPRGMPRRGGPAAIKSRRSLLTRPSGCHCRLPGGARSAGSIPSFVSYVTSSSGSCSRYYRDRRMVGPGSQCPRPTMISATPGDFHRPRHTSSEFRGV